MTPDIRTVVSDKDGNIPDEGDSTFAGVLSEGMPLVKKEEL